jgi:hypothetical protein
MFKSQKQLPSPMIHSEVGTSNVKDLEPSRAFNVPTGKSKLTDLIDNHDGHTNFGYVTLLPSSDSDLDMIRKNISARINRKLSALFHMKPIPVIDLKGPHHEFSFKACIDTLGRDKEILKRAPWIKITQLFLIFDGAADFFAEQTTIKFTMKDNRYRKPVNSFEGTCNSNGRTVLRAELGHSVHYKNIESLVLEVDNSSLTFNPDVYWGSMQLEVEISVSDRAESGSIVPLDGMIAVDPTMLEELKRDPRTIDLQWSQPARKGLAGMLRKGLLRNLALPENRQPAKKGKVGSVAGSVSSADKQDSSAQEDPVQEWVKSVSPMEVIPEDPTPESSGIKEEVRSVEDVIESGPSYNQAPDVGQPRPIMSHRNLPTPRSIMKSPAAVSFST